MPEIDTFVELLQWLLAGGAVAVVVWAVSWIPEDWSWWHKLQKEVKYAVQVGLSMVIGAGAVFLLRLPAEDLSQVDPWVKAIFVLLAASWSYLNNQAAHKVNKKLSG